MNLATKKWVFLKLSSIILVPLMFWFIINFISVYDGDYSEVVSFFSNKTNLKVLEELQKILNIEIIKPIKSNGLLNDKTFMITGKLEGISRAEIKSLIEKNSGSIISNVSKKLNYLITGNKPTKRKVDMANELKIKILSLAELLKMLNITS